MPVITMLKFGARVALSNLGFHAPYSLNFAITYKCNSHCQNCRIWKSRPKDELTLAEIRRLAKHLKFVKWLRLTGGEPFLRGDFVDIVRAMDRNIPGLFMLTTTTNAILSDDIYRKIVKVLRFFRKKFIVAISLDGDRETHDRLRGVPGNWDRAIDLYLRLKELARKHKNLEVYFGYTIYPKNVGMFRQTYAAVKEKIPELKPGDFHINILQISDIYYANRGQRVPKDFYKKTIEELDGIRKMRGVAIGPIAMIDDRYLKLAPKYLKTRKSPIRCNILDLSAFIDSSGNVYPCVSYDRKLGNVRDYDYNLMKVLKHETSRQVGKEIKKGKCPHCWNPCEAHPVIVSNWFRRE